MIESFQVEWGTGLTLTTVDTGLCPIFFIIFKPLNWGTTSDSSTVEHR